MNLKIRITPTGVVRVVEEEARVTGDGKKSNINKRKRDISVDYDQLGDIKRRRMDSRAKVLCGCVLKALMDDESGKDLSEKPMDLGTVKRKLERNMYFDVEGFAADIKLTFSSTAMLLLLEQKFKLEAKNVDQAKAGICDSLQSNIASTKTWARNSRQYCTKRSTVPAAMKSMSTEEEKRMLKPKHVELSKRKITTTIRKFGWNDLKEGRLEAFIAAADDDTLQKLRRPTKGTILDREAKKQVEAAKDSKHDQSMGKNVQKCKPFPVDCKRSNYKQSIGCRRKASITVNNRQSSNCSEGASCGKVTCCCHIRSDSTPTHSTVEAKMDWRNEDARMRREKERKAARLEVQKVQKTVDIDDNFKIQNDLEKLVRCDTSYGGSQIKGHDLWRAVHGYHCRFALQKLGLFIKDEYADDDDQ